jgi:hypothetical protein
MLRKPSITTPRPHECTRLLASKNNLKTSSRFYGVAIHEIEYAKGQWWVNSDHEEYSTAILFCPFCGIRLEEGP